jgi:hypothetical protein
MLLRERYMFDPPFRWNITNQAHLGTLVKGDKAYVYAEFYDQILPCCSRVLSFADDSDLVFVGRSPESIFDHLSGLLFHTSWFDRLELLQFSMRFRDESEIRQQDLLAVSAMRSYLQSLGLHPEGLATRFRPAAFVDLVASGDTFGRLITFLHTWSEEIDFDWNAVKRRIRLVGITGKTKTSPNTWRWQQHVSWKNLLAQGAIKNVSIPNEMWNYLGNLQEKLTRSYTPEQWVNPTASSPNHDDSHLRALRLAFELFELGKTQRRREDFALLMVKEPTMKEAWYRRLVQEIRAR